MIRRIAVASRGEDVRARAHLHTFKSLFPEASLTGVSAAQLYTTDADITDDEARLFAQKLANPITERSEIGTIPAPASYAFAIEIGFLPGVTDNVGATARETLADAIGRALSEQERVYSSTMLFFEGALSPAEAERFAGELHNPLIERATIYEGAQAEFPPVVPKVELGESAPAMEVDLEVADEELARIGREGIAEEGGGRRGPLSLSLPQMRAIQAYFRKAKRKPTDVELEAIAQTWSEHCKHTIFADPLDEVKEGIYRRYIKGATEKIRKKKGKKDFCVSVFKDNSGAIAFGPKHLVTHKVETHNAPSALDPFGGSVTAIVGVNRDALGFGLGAKPIANTYGFFVADPADARTLYRDINKTQPLLPARRILEGVVRGVNAGGNQSGIPTPLGVLATDPSYRGKPLVFGGTVGLIPRAVKGRKLYEKRARPGDYIVMAGGRVGLDGIHGATFSSEALSAGSPATAVQIGDPITQKKLSDALIREARGQGLYSSITDNGAGGLSGAVGEMARESNGCEVDLSLVPLKYPGLSPWQIWLSESQERMTLAVPKRKWKKLKAIFDRHGVEATVIGAFTKSGSCVVKSGKTTVMDLKLSFLHDGRPVAAQKSRAPSPQASARGLPPAREWGETILELLGRPSIGSTAFIARQYDSEVQGTSVTKPLIGKGQVQADAAVMQPLLDSPRGIVLSHGFFPWYSALDTYAMAAASIDAAVRAAVCAGASRSYLAILDNFCWSSSERPERLFELKRAARACYDIALAYGTPFISGKDSMHNDFRGFDEEGRTVHIAALPTLLVSAIGVIPDVSRAATPDPKRAGDLVYLVGETADELGASEYFLMRNQAGGAVPQVNAKKNAKAYDALDRAIGKGLVASAISVGRGGLAAALAKAAIAGGLGLDVRLADIPGGAREEASLLFSESQGRVLITVAPERRKEAEKEFRGVPFAHIGETSQEAALSIALPRGRVMLPLSALAGRYRSYFKDW